MFCAMRDATTHPAEPALTIMWVKEDGCISTSAKLRASTPSQTSVKGVYSWASNNEGKPIEGKQNSAHVDSTLPLPVLAGERKAATLTPVGCRSG